MAKTADCTSEKSSSYLASAYFASSFGYDSKCLATVRYSPALNGFTENYDCVRYRCEQDDQKLILRYEEKEYECSNDKDITVLSAAGSDRTQSVKLKCPKNTLNFCRHSKFCPRFCSLNGVCLDGTCHCLQGFAGEDCSLHRNSPALPSKAGPSSCLLRKKSTVTPISFLFPFGTLLSWTTPQPPAWADRFLICSTSLCSIYR